MKRILVFALLLGSLITKGQTSLSFARLLTDFPAPGRGAQNWGLHTINDITQPTIPAGNTVLKNYYQRFNWLDIENNGTKGVDGVQGNYTWSDFDNFVNQAIDNGAMFTFGVMPLCDGCGAGGAIPLYVQNLMTAEGKPCPTINGIKYPNYQSTNWKARYSALLRACAAHIAVMSRNGKSYTSAFYAFDLRHFANFGEAGDPIATGAGANQYPATAQVTEAYLISMVDTAIAQYPNVQLTIPFQYITVTGNAYGNANGNVDVSSAYKVLTAQNNVGYIGWRRDNIGDLGYNVYFTGNTGSFNPGTGSVSFQPLLMDRWKLAPVGGEPSANITGVTTTSGCAANNPYCDMHNENTLLHLSYFGDGNAPGSISNTSGATWTNMQANWRASSAEQGYSLWFSGGTMTTTLNTNANFNVTLNWNNTGLGPTYERWNVTYELRTLAGAVTASWTSTFSPKLFLPTTSAVPVSDNLNLGAIAAGTYNIYVKITDPNGYKAPLPLAITGRGADGAYLVRSNVIVTSGGNVPPTAAINGLGTITLPTSSVTLDGFGSFDPDGSIATYSWSRVSGPNIPTIVSPTGASTNITGLIAGTYVFSLAVVDNLGATGSTTKQVIVVPAPPAGIGVFTSQTPVTGVSNDGGPIEVGMKFQSTSSGYINGLRFYKVAGNTGTHTGELYNQFGTLLAQADFQNESATGWQYLSFPTPVFISANTTYMAAYWSSLGNYVVTNNGFNGGTTNSTLTGLADGVDGNNGLYRYASFPSVPNTAGTKANYWVDVYFTPNGSFTIGNGVPGSSVQLISMAGHNYGDTAYVMPPIGGYYSNLALKDIQGIVIKPFNSTRPVFSTTSQVCRIKDVKINTLSFKGTSGIGIDASCGPWTNVTLQNIYIGGWPSTGISAHMNLLYTGDTTTYLWNNVNIDSVFLDSTGQFIQGSFGRASDNSGNPPDVYHHLNLSRIVDWHTNVTAGQGTGVWALCFACSARDIWIIDRSGRGASGDRGFLYGSGAWFVDGMHKYGGPGYDIRLDGPVSELNEPFDNVLINSFKGFGTEYGFANYQFTAGDAVAGKFYGPSSHSKYNTMVYQFNDPFGYWSTMYNFGTVAPGAVYETCCSVGVGIGENNNNNNKPKMAVNLGGWATMAGDTSRLYYFTTATLAFMDTAVNNWVLLIIGTLPSYALSPSSPAYLLQTGPPIIYAQFDSRGTAYGATNNLGYLQGLGSIVPPTPRSKQFMIHKKGLYGWKNK